jgi:hypothetical protein
MSSKVSTKESSAKASSKKVKGSESKSKKKDVVVEENIESSDNDTEEETTTNIGPLTGYLRKTSTEIPIVLKTVKILSQSFASKGKNEDEVFSDFLKALTEDSLEELLIIVKKAKHRQHKKASVFKAVDKDGKEIRIPSAWNVFSKANREKEAKSSGLSGKELTSHLAKMWAAIKEKNGKDFKKYNTQHQTSIDELEVTRKKQLNEAIQAGKWDLPPPKKPMTAFLIFSTSEERTKYRVENGISVSEAAKKNGEIWKGMSDKKKTPFMKKREKLLEEYKKSYTLWEKEKAKIESNLQKTNKKSKSKSNESDANESDANESDANESDGNKSDANESDANESDGNKSDANESDESGDESGDENDD